MKKQLKIVLEDKYHQHLPEKSTNQLLAVVADESTCAGFVLAGIGEIRDGQKNFIVAEQEKSLADLQHNLEKLLKRDDIALVLITDDVFRKVETVVKKHGSRYPIILEIPSPYKMYNLQRDQSLTHMAKGNIHGASIMPKPTRSILLNVDDIGNRVGIDDKTNEHKD